MKITICGSIAFYSQMLEVKDKLEKLGHSVKLPPHEVKDESGKMIPVKEYYSQRKSENNENSWIWDRKEEAMRWHFEKVEFSDAIIVLNYDKNGIKNYIGANTLLEMGLAFYFKKKIFLLNEIPEISYKEEILGMKPIIIHEDLNEIKKFENKINYSLIAAVPDNFVIGNGLKIPWYIPEDFKLFKERTLNNVIIMGKNTWDSLPIKPLPNRINIVLSKEKIMLGGAIVATSLEEAFQEASKYIDKEIFVIGGAYVYSQTIHDAKYLYISHVKGNFEGEVFFPKFDKNKYKIIEEKKFEKFTFRKYERIE